MYPTIDTDTNVYIIGDVHLSMDLNVDKPMDIYGGVWEKHSQRLYDNWQGKIKKNDVVILAGDISWGLKLSEAMADLQWLSNLNGQKVIFKGNHDLWWGSISKLNKLFDNITFIQNDFFHVGDIAICGTRGWVCPGSDQFEENDDKLYKRELLRLETSLSKAKEAGFEKIIGVLHYPPTNEKRQPSGFTEMFEKYGVKQVFYGHLHNEEAKRNKSIVNFNGVSYKLISFDAIDGDPYKINIK